VTAVLGLGIEKVRRLQIVTLVALVALVGLQVARFLRDERRGPPPPGGDPERRIQAIDARVGAADARAGAAEGSAAAARREAEELKRRLDAMAAEAERLAKRTGDLEAALGEARSALAAAAPRAIPFERRVHLQVRRERDGLRFRVADLAPSGPDFKLSSLQPKGERAAGLFPASGEASIPLGPAFSGRPPAEAPPRGRVLVQASALVASNNGVREDRGAPKRLALACVGRDGARQGFDLASGFFKVDDTYPTDALRKETATSGAFVVAVDDPAELFLLVDAGTLAARFQSDGELDVIVRIGPALAIGAGGGE